MGYAHYALPDGRDAGYGVEATCDADGCDAEIDRGLGYLCGDSPDGHRDPDEPGCGKYHCPQHQADHACKNPECGTYSDGGDGDLCCTLARGHEDGHFDRYDEAAFAA